MNYHGPKESKDEPQALSEDAKPTADFSNSSLSLDGILGNSLESPLVTSIDAMKSHTPIQADIAAKNFQPGPESMASTQPVSQPSSTACDHEVATMPNSDVLSEELIDANNFQPDPESMASTQPATHPSSTASGHEVATMQNSDVLLEELMDANNFQPDPESMASTQPATHPSSTACDHEVATMLNSDAVPEELLDANTFQPDPESMTSTQPANQSSSTPCDHEVATMPNSDVLPEELMAANKFQPDPESMASTLPTTHPASTACDHEERTMPNSYVLPNELMDANFFQPDPESMATTQPPTQPSSPAYHSEESMMPKSDALPEELLEPAPESLPHTQDLPSISIPESLVSHHYESELEGDSPTDRRASRPLLTSTGSQSPSTNGSSPQVEKSQSIAKSLKRPLDGIDMVAPASKQPKIEALVELLPMAPTQPEPLAIPPPTDEVTVPPTSDVEIPEAIHSMEVFPGGRGVPSPTYGSKDRCTQSPLVEMSFSSKLASNRNPFRSRSHRPFETNDWKGGLPLLRTNEFRLISDPEKPIVDDFKSVKGGLFDSAEVESVSTVTKSRQKVKKKKASPPLKRLSLNESNFTSPKEIATAVTLLTGINGLTGIIPRKDATWLGANMWIFTVEQLEFSLSAPPETAGGEPGHDLLEALARSALCGVNEATVLETEAKPLSVPCNDSTKGASNVMPETPDKGGVAVADPTLSSPGSVGTTAPVSNTLEVPQNENATSPLGDRSAFAIDSLPDDTSSKDELNQERAINEGSVIGGDGCARMDIDAGEDLPPLHAIDDVAALPKDNVVAESQRTVSIPISGHAPSHEHLQRAATIMQRWRGSVAKFRSGANKKGSDKFLLSGPIGQLLPELVKQFLESMRVSTLLAFFSLKKTEASPLIAYYVKWRHHCLLPHLKEYCLSRHLIGMSIRLEKAVRSIPPADAETRKWMSTVLVILTGSSKEFIIDECKVLDVDHFLNERTKAWSDRLVLWRGRHNLPPLKGSGKVAMVSGWKTSLKDSLDVENGQGRVLTEAEFLEAPPRGLDDEEREAEPEIAPKPVKNPSKASPEPVRYKKGKEALRSEEFLVSVLKADNVRFLNSIGIRNAEQLIECDKQPTSAAISALINYRTDATSIQAQPATCVRLMYDWTLRVKTKLTEIKCHAVGTLAKKRGPKCKEDGEPQSPVLSVPPTKSTPKPVRPKSSLRIFSDPMEALSASARSFLGSLGIFDANTFLATKTSVMSIAYVPWRESENMPPLKGYGAIATVSGWKAQIRKAAMDAGKHNLAATEPADRYGKISAVVAKVNVEPVPSFFDSVVVVRRRSSSLLFGMPEKKFYVQGPTGACIFRSAYYLTTNLTLCPAGLTFAFELSVRDSTSLIGEVSTFLTYLGHWNSGTIQPNILDAEDNDRLPLLVDVSDTWDEADQAVLRSSFSSLGEGFGVIDVGKYGAFKQPEGNIDLIKGDIMALLESKAGSFDEQMVDDSRDDGTGSALPGANVYHVAAPLRRTCQVFFQATPLQRGQVVELVSAKRRISCAAAPLRESQTVQLRSRITNQMSNLTTFEIDEILRWILGQRKPPLCAAVRNQMESTVLRRRFHWVASSLLFQFDVLVKISERQHKQPGIMDRAETYKLADSLLMNGTHFQDIRSASEPSKHPNYDCLLGEIFEEIDASLITNGGGTSPSDPTIHCQAAVTLRKECQHAASTFILLKAQDSLKCQEALLNEFCKLARNATSSILSNETQLELLVLSRQDESGQSEDVIATGSNCRMPVFRPLEDVRSGDADVNRYWYLHHQIFSAVHSVASCTQIPWLHSPAPVYTYNILVAEVGEAMPSNHRDQIVDSTTPDWSRISNFMDRSMFSGFTSVSSVPSSLPLFLGLVWPTLRSRFGWRIDAGESKNSVIFLPPGHNSRAKRRNDVTAKVKHERQKKRAKLDTNLEEVGFGYVSKLTKRLVVQAHTSESGNGKAEISVRCACKMFGEFVLSKTSNPRSETHRLRVDAIVNGICKCFDELLPIVEPSLAVGDTCDPLSRKYGCEQLITMLIVMPSVLRQSDLPIRQIEDSTNVIKDLVKYLTGHYDQCFNAEFRPFFEAYGGREHVADDFLSPKLDTISIRDDDGQSAISVANNEEASMVRDLLLPEDVNDLTEFTAMAMRQMAPCRAGESDCSKKGRKHIPVGYSTPVWCASIVGGYQSQVFLYFSR